MPRRSASAGPQPEPLKPICSTGSSTTFIDARPSAKRLEMVPTEFFGMTDSPYKTALRSGLDARMIVERTGAGVTPAIIIADQAAQAAHVFGHDVLVWDNYPVNDSTPDQLHMGPYTRREPGVTDHVGGVTANCW